MQASPETAIQSILNFYKSQLNTAWAKELEGEEGLWIDLVHLGQHLCRARIEWKKPKDPQFKLWQYLNQLGQFQVKQAPLPNGQTTTYFRPTNWDTLETEESETVSYPTNNRVIYTKETCLARIEEMAKNPDQYPIKEFGRMRYIFIACCKKEESALVDEYVANGGRREDFPFTVDPGIARINEIISEIKSSRPAPAAPAPRKPSALNHGLRLMLDFAFFGFNPQGESQFGHKMELLQQMALPESWLINGDDDISDYFINQFIQARNEGKLLYGVEGRLCALNTGLVDRSYRPIFAMFNKNRLQGRQPWVFASFAVMGQDITPVALNAHGVTLLARPNMDWANPQPKYQRKEWQQHLSTTPVGHDMASDTADKLAEADSQYEQAYADSKADNDNSQPDDEFVHRPKGLSSFISFGKSMFGNR